MQYRRPRFAPETMAAVRAVMEADRPRPRNDRHRDDEALHERWMQVHRRRVERRREALRVLRDALERADELAERNALAYADPEWGSWYRQANERIIYKSAVERAIEVLEGRDDHA